jgi:prepilin-type N-terminal cleavage/methylation domain-containing protein/prepilin-type processing-associated H-X9-DG protein
MRDARAFTLIELLVTLTIIAVLVGILLPSLGAVRDHGRSVKCLSNVRQIAIASSTYAADNADFIYPTSQMYMGVPYFEQLQRSGHLPRTSQVHRCPDDADEGPADGWANNAKGDGERVTSYAINGYLAANHDPYYGVSLEDIRGPAEKVFAAEIIEQVDKDHFMPMYWGASSAIHPGPGTMMARPMQIDPSEGNRPRIISRDRHHGGSHFAFADGHAAHHEFGETWDDTIANRTDRDNNGKTDRYDPLY